MSQTQRLPARWKFPNPLRRRPRPREVELTDGVSELAVAYSCQIDLEQLPPHQAVRVCEYLSAVAEERLKQLEAHERSAA